MRGETHQCPLFAALANGNKDAVAALFNLPSTIYDGEDITAGLNYIKNMGDYVTRTPLSWAAQEGRVGLVKLLLLAQADANERDEAGQTPLFRAQSKMHWPVVAILIKAGADVYGKSYMYNNGNEATRVTQLMYASAENDEISARLLIQNGAKVGAICYDEARRGRGETALTIASRHGHEAIARFLIENCAFTDVGETNALAAAAENGHINVVRLLTEKCIHPSMKCCGGPALLKALHHGHVAIASLLISMGVDIDFWSKFDEPLACSPLVVACKNGHESLVRLLLSKGARIDHPDPYFKSPLISAVLKGQEAIAKLLIRRGAGVNKLAHHSTPLIAASEAGHEAMVRLLIDNGADVNQVSMLDGGASTPLHSASMAGHEAVVRLLLDHGAQAVAWGTL